MYAWTITKDHIADLSAARGTNANAESMVGPSRAKLTHDEIVAHPDKQYFQMFDDDGELYYEGYIVGDHEGFEPLDDFGQPNAGATTIKYANKQGQMVPL